jgi:hypothetical protein
VKDRAATMPAGATVVKVKWWVEEGEPHAYAAMIKREPGYDPAHGDWEYVYETFGEAAKVERGKLENCIACHKLAKDRDYLFRDYLNASAPGKAPEKSGQ